MIHRHSPLSSLRTRHLKRASLQNHSWATAKPTFLLPLLVSGFSAFSSGCVPYFEKTHCEAAVSDPAFNPQKIPPQPKISRCVNEKGREVLRMAFPSHEAPWLGLQNSSGTAIAFKFRNKLVLLNPQSFTYETLAKPMADHWAIGENCLLAWTPNDHALEISNLPTKTLNYHLFPERIVAVEKPTKAPFFFIVTANGGLFRVNESDLLRGEIAAAQQIPISAALKTILGSKEDWHLKSLGDGKTLILHTWNRLTAFDTQTATVIHDQALVPGPRQYFHPIVDTFLTSFSIFHCDEQGKRTLDVFQIGETGVKKESASGYNLTQASPFEGVIAVKPLPLVNTVRYYFPIPIWEDGAQTEQDAVFLAHKNGEKELLFRSTLEHFAVPINRFRFDLQALGPIGPGHRVLLPSGHFRHLFFNPLTKIVIACDSNGILFKSTVD